MLAAGELPILPMAPKSGLENPAPLGRAAAVD